MSCEFFTSFYLRLKQGLTVRFRKVSFTLFELGICIAYCFLKETSDHTRRETLLSSEYSGSETLFTLSKAEWPKLPFGSKLIKLNSRKPWVSVDRIDKNKNKITCPSIFKVWLNGYEFKHSFDRFRRLNRHVEIRSDVKSLTGGLGMIFSRLLFLLHI